MFTKNLFFESIFYKPWHFQRNFSQDKAWQSFSDGSVLLHSTVEKSLQEHSIVENY